MNWKPNPRAFDQGDIARLIEQRDELLAALRQAIDECGHKLSGPTDWRAAEHGEPQWVCSARAAIAKAKGE
jgi:hypothetical protein